MIRKIAVATAVATAVLSLGVPAASAETGPFHYRVYPDHESAQEACFTGIAEKLWVSCKYETPQHAKPPATELLVFMD